MTPSPNTLIEILSNIYTLRNLNSNILNNNKPFSHNASIIVLSNELHPELQQRWFGSTGAPVIPASVYQRS